MPRPRAILQSADLKDSPQVKMDLPAPHTHGEYNIQYSLSTEAIRGAVTGARLKMGFTYVGGKTERERETVKADETTLLGRPGDRATPGNGGGKIMYTTLEGTE